MSKTYIVAVHEHGVMELEGAQYLNDIEDIIADTGSEALEKYNGKHGYNYFRPKVVGEVVNEERVIYNEFIGIGTR